MLKRYRVNLSIDKDVWRKFKAYCDMHDKVPSFEIESYMLDSVNKAGDEK